MFEGLSTMLAIVGSLVAGAATFLAYAALRIILDLRSRALADARSALDEHTNALEQLVHDPATPNILSEFAVKVGRRLAREDMWPMALRVIGGNVELSSKQNDEYDTIIAELDALEAHRPDLSKSFRHAMVTGIYAAAFRQIANEASPLRIYREAKLAKSVRNSTSEREIARRAGASFAFGDLSPAA